MDFAAQTPLFAVNVALHEDAAIGLRGQPLHTGIGGLIAAADAQTHADVLAIVNRRFG